MRIAIIVFMLLTFVFTPGVFADEKQYITLPNNTQLDITNLTDEQVNEAIKIARRSITPPEEIKTVVDTVKDLDPNKLNAWRELLTGTIKDICNDLNIAVNDFVKTPVGLGIAALITYKVAGKDLLDNALDIIIMVPFWSFVTGVCLFFGWYFFSMKTIYKTTYDKDTGKLIEKTPERVHRYNTKGSTRESVGWISLIIWIIVTLITLIIIL